MPSNFVKILTICAAMLLLPATAFAQTSSLDDGLVAEALPAGFCLTQSPTGRTLCEQAANEYAQGHHVMAAENWEKAAQLLSERSERLRAPGEDAQVWPGQVDLLVLSANAWETSEAYSRAGLAYLKAAKIADNLAPYLHYKAAQNLVRAPNPPTDILARIRQGDALKQGFAGSDLVEAKIEALLNGGLPAAETLTTALTGSAAREACMWASAEVVTHAAKPGAGALQELVYGHCLPDEVDAKFPKLKLDPPAAMRLARADRWFGAVRFKNALAELETVDLAKLDPVARCKAQFRHGRTVYRLKRRTEAIGIYENIIKTCTDPKNEDERIRSLYAAGNMQFWRSKFDTSKDHFATIASEYPTRTHADDALLYLARIARKQNDSATEKNYVELALEKYPDGDMLHEIVWEYTEDAFRKGEYSTFLKMLGELKMPDFDPNYFSQGRLKYFKGHAHAQLGERNKAESIWQETWASYPFSFYGYLARERLVQAKAVPASIDAGAKMQVVDWFLDPQWANSAGAKLANLKLYGMAADVERARQKRAANTAQKETSDTDYWRLGLLEHLAGRYPSSHNIARRKIVGRPWAEPETGRTVRWRIAWPNPFGRDILRAIVAERRQASPGVLVEPALPAAIMREESSFIEDIESYAGALGLMQLMPRTAGAHDDDIPGGSNLENLKTSLVNIRVGVDHLNSLAKRFDNQPVLIAAAYNAGGGAVSGWIKRKRTSDIALWVEDIPYDQTRNYTKRVIGSYAAYQWLRGIRELDPSVLNAP